MLLNEMIIDENNIAFIPSLGSSFELNESAKRVIELLKEGQSKEEIVQTLSKEYHKRWEDIYIDVEDFLQKLKIYGLIQ